MKRVPILIAMLFVAACGESKPPLSAEHTQMTKACVAGGGDQTHCECQATKLDELLAAEEIDPAEVNQATVIRAIEGLGEVPLNAGPSGTIAADKHKAGDHLFLADYNATDQEFVDRPDEPVAIDG